MRRHPLLRLLQPLRPRLRHQVALAVAHREQVEQRPGVPLEELQAEVPEEVLVVPPEEVLAVPLALEALRAQVELPALELLLRARLEQSLEQFLP